MRKFHFAVMVATAGACAVALAGGAAASPGGPKASVLGQVYINDNTAPVNTVAGYNRLSDGTLAALPGSPFVVGGIGGGGADASQGSLQLSADGRYACSHVDRRVGEPASRCSGSSQDGSLQIAQVKCTVEARAAHKPASRSTRLRRARRRGRAGRARQTTTPATTSIGFTLNRGRTILAPDCRRRRSRCSTWRQARRRRLQRRRHEARRCRRSDVARGMRQLGHHRHQRRAPGPCGRLARTPT